MAVKGRKSPGRNELSHKQMVHKSTSQQSRPIVIVIDIPSGPSTLKFEPAAKFLDGRLEPGVHSAQHVRHAVFVLESGGVVEALVLTADRDVRPEVEYYALEDVHRQGEGGPARA